MANSIQGAITQGIKLAIRIPIVVSISNWILRTGAWDDAGEWEDDDNWID